MIEETLASEKLVTSCVEVHYPEDFLNPHYLHLSLDITSDIELISTTDGVYSLFHCSHMGFLTDQECARQLHACDLACSLFETLRCCLAQ